MPNQHISHFDDLLIGTHCGVHCLGMLIASKEIVWHMTHLKFPTTPHPPTPTTPTSTPTPQATRGLDPKWLPCDQKDKSAQTSPATTKMATNAAESVRSFHVMQGVLPTAVWVLFKLASFEHCHRLIDGRSCCLGLEISMSKLPRYRLLHCLGQLKIERNVTHALVQMHLV